MKLIFLVIALVLVGLLLPIGSVQAISDPIGVSSTIFYIDTKEGGEALIKLGVDNVTTEPIEVKVSLWNKFTYPDTGTQWIDSSWCSSISPDTQILPVGGGMISNIQFSIPADAPEVKYITWIKVAVGGFEKPITVIIRKGAAIQKIDFSVGPAYYRMLADRYPAHIDVDGLGGTNPIGVRNKSSVPLSVYAIAEKANEDITITESSSIEHTEEEVGTVYESISAETAQDWFSTDYTLDSPLSVDGFNRADLTWSLDIPDSVANGHYVLGVRIAPAEGGSGLIVTNYLVLVLVDVQREHGGGWLGNNWMYLVAGLAGLLVLGELAYYRYSG